MINTCYLIFDEDFKHHNWMDWIKARVMGAPPPHLLSGVLILIRVLLNFEGFDSYLNETAGFSIKQSDITQIYHGFDATYNAFQSRSI